MPDTGRPSCRPGNAWSWASSAGRPRPAAAALMGCLAPFAALSPGNPVEPARRAARTCHPLHDINRLLWRNWTVNDGANVASLHSGYHGELARRSRNACTRVPSSWTGVMPRGSRDVPPRRRARFGFSGSSPLSAGLQALRDRRKGSRPGSRNGFDPSSRDTPVCHGPRRTPGRVGPGDVH